ncbi:hypothetical protein OJ998_04915 [Solirubrobacter taibaiensis]|nr:hypothetical protein [Solirubrobacter taibaiensis]
MPASGSPSPWLRRTQELLPEMMRRVEAIWPDVITDFRLRAEVGELLFQVASIHALKEADERRLKRAIEELETLRKETPAATVAVTNVFQTINNITVDHHVTIKDSISVTDNAAVSSITVNPAPRQPVMTVDRAIALLALLLSLLQTYAALKPDEPAKPTPTHEQTVAQPERPR